MPSQSSLLKRSPVFCGLLSAHLQLKVQQAGIAFVNAWPAARFLCHLYNALQKEQLLKCSWPDLDMLISLHNRSSGDNRNQVFFGDPPTSRMEYLRKWRLSIFVTGQDFPSNPRQLEADKQRILESGDVARGFLVDTTPVCDAFREQLCDVGEADHESLLRQLEEALTEAKPRSPVDAYWPLLKDIVQEHPELDQVLEEDGGDVTPLCQELAQAGPGQVDLDTAVQVAAPSIPAKAEPGSRAPLALLEQLFAAVSRETAALGFDYFGLHRRCWQLLRRLRPDLDADFRRRIGGQSYVERESQLPHIVGYCLMIGAGGHRSAAEPRPPPSTAPLLVKAARTIDGFLAAGMGSLEVVRALCRAPGHLGFDDVEFVAAGEAGDEVEGLEEISSLSAAMASLRS